MIRWWITLWDRREPATAQVLVRILVGLCVLGDLVDVARLGLVDTIWEPLPFWIAFAAAIAFTLGLLTRVAGVVLVLALAKLASLWPDGDRGIDAVFRVTICVLVLSSCHARWSIDAWFRRKLGRPFPDEVPAWPRYLLFAQLVWIYFSSAHNKMEPEWTPVGGFAALGNVLSDPHYARFSSGWVASAWPLANVATFVTMAFEWSAPLLLLPGRDRFHFRRIWIAVGVGFHVGIAIFLRLGVFPYGMLALYPVLLPPDELRSRA